jgi:hypothetical protein
MCVSSAWSNVGNSLLPSCASMTSSSDQTYLLELAQNSVLGTPTEHDAYGVITEAFILHKQPRNRYTIFPQLFIPWNPLKADDKRGSLPDFGLGRYFPDPPHVRLQGGVEVKRATASMRQLPPPRSVGEHYDVKNTLHICSFQAEDQAKAAVKGSLLPNKPLLWLIFVGPYFTIIKLGPFTAAQLITRGHKPNHSGDFVESTAISVQKDKEPITHNLYLLGTPDAASKLEDFITTTSTLLLD